MLNGSDSRERTRNPVLMPVNAPLERRVGASDRRRGPQGDFPTASATRAIDRMWKVRDVAEFYQVSESWVRHAAAGGRLPCIKIGGLLRFDPDEIRSLARTDASARLVAARCG